MFDFSNFDINAFMVKLALSVVPFLFAVTVHEVMHGFVAYKLGDSTAKDLGRLTLNPIKHIDPIGLAVLLLTRMFGWAKPVPVNYNNMRGHKYAVAMVSAAGPLSNLFLAFLSALVYKLFVFFAMKYGFSTFYAEPIIKMIEYSIVINVALCVFNLLPIMPFDGARIISNFLPLHLAYKYEMTERYGLLIVFALFITGAMNYIIRPPMEFVLNLVIKVI